MLHLYRVFMCVLICCSGFQYIIHSDLRGRVYDSAYAIDMVDVFVCFIAHFSQENPFYVKIVLYWKLTVFKSFAVRSYTCEWRVAHWVLEAESFESPKIFHCFYIILISHFSFNWVGQVEGQKYICFELCSVLWKRRFSDIYVISVEGKEILLFLN